MLAVKMEGVAAAKKEREIINAQLCRADIREAFFTCCIGYMYLQYACTPHALRHINACGHTNVLYVYSTVQCN